MQVFGVMSGSSLDGLDIACVEFEDSQEFSWSLLYTRSYSMEEDLRERLHHLTRANIHEVIETEYLFSNWVAKCIRDIQKQKVSSAGCVGIHGHTLIHSPKFKKSWQLLNAGFVAESCHLDVVHDFRDQDMAHGGQGTPMAVIADRDLFPGYDYYLNLGGICNISYMREGRWMAYDLSPFNQVHNHFAAKRGKEYDTDGQMASSGRVHINLLQWFARHPFVQKAIPKSLDNTELKEEWISAMPSMNVAEEDILISFNQFICDLIYKILEEKPGRMLVTGGGVKNSFFIKMLARRLDRIGDLSVPENDIIEFKEAILMAYMAFLRVSGKANFIPEASGAHSAVCGGAVYYVLDKEKM